jgi:hypothetical protein
MRVNSDFKIICFKKKTHSYLQLEKNTESQFF